MVKDSGILEITDLSEGPKSVPDDGSLDHCSPLNECDPCWVGGGRGRDMRYQEVECPFREQKI